ncbi:MAG: DUF885 domain-containing protein [Dehalococcoidia bacterium]|nr:DUF885 domain-containing protein [Dehalococcoidia bacterium]|tara:strand:- start:10419 stop:12092 length:1674 start_codon:yes stop_codon:yes gene_type:complete
MSAITNLGDAYVEELAALHPNAATSLGISGHEEELTDYSRDGFDQRDQLTRNTLARLEDLPLEENGDRLLREIMREVLTVDIELHETGDYLAGLNVLASPLQGLRSTFDLMPTEGEADWATIARRLTRLPEALAAYRTTLEAGLETGRSAPRRQVEACLRQCEAWAGNGDGGFFEKFVSGAGNDLSEGLHRDLGKAASSASQSYRAFGQFLRDVYLPRASEQDATGRERYSLYARSWNRCDLDLLETYSWGWDEIARIDTSMEEAAEQIAPGEGVEAAKVVLDTDPKRAIEGVEPFRQWMQELQERTIADLNGKHFDIPKKLQRLEAMIAPPGGALAMYYTGPSEDFSRPGRTWYPTGGKTRFPLWGEVSIAYHEGVPGHHLERGNTRLLELSRFQRLLGDCSGYVEGWALYAERLMGELGYLDSPDYQMGLLRSQALRSVRVIIDIGMHLELPLPESQQFHPGEHWTPELGAEFAKTRSHFPADFMTSEIDRYLGLPGQAISYKVGERAWLAARDSARQSLGDAFDLTTFHRQTLALGPMGLGLLTQESAHLGNNS